MTHAWHDVTPGLKLPLEFTSVIEIPRGSSVKYELDKNTVSYGWTEFCTRPSIPANYGFIPQTLAEDDDPLSTCWCSARRRSIR